MKNNNISSISGFLNSKKLLDKDRKLTGLSKDGSQKTLSKSFVRQKEQQNNNYEFQNTSSNLGTSAQINLKSSVKQQTGVAKFHKTKSKVVALNQFDSQKTVQPPITNYPVEIQNFSATKPKQKSYFQEINRKSESKKYQQPLYQYEQSPTLNPNRKSNSLWGDVTNVDNAFNSSRLEAKQCLQNLSRRIKKQLNTLDDTIRDFSNKLKYTLETQYYNLRQSIKETIENIFKECENQIFSNAKKEEEIANIEIYQTRRELENMFKKVEKMKQGIEGTNWKKIAGELLSSQIEQQVDLLIKLSQRRSSMTNINLTIDKKKTNLYEQALVELLDLRIVKSKPQEKKYLRTSNNFD